VLLEQRLNGVPAGQQIAAIQVQFLGQVLGGDPLRDAAHNLENDPAGVARFAKDRAGEEVKDGAALPTAVVEERSPVAVMGRLVGGQGMAVRTDQAVRVEPLTQVLIAPRLVQQLGNRPNQHRYTSAAERYT
jgi:hypothetical protein